ncbi:RICIN domain-containing protein [Streptomyces sp. NPDC001982]|uniref:RICIN domain-containing protein n=1 Tax=unclassified Streptomyces TaxID=2593676 RepID=UPI003330903A
MAEGAERRGSFRAPGPSATRSTRATLAQRRRSPGSGPRPGPGRRHAGTRVVRVPARRHLQRDRRGTGTVRQPDGHPGQSVRRQGRHVPLPAVGGTNQRWTVTAVPAGYTLTSLKSGLLLTTASTADGAPVTQEADSGSALQHWSLG